MNTLGISYHVCACVFIYSCSASQPPISLVVAAVAAVAVILLSKSHVYDCVFAVHLVEKD